MSYACAHTSHTQLYPDRQPDSLLGTTSEKEICCVTGTFSQLQIVWGREGRKWRVVNKASETMSSQSPAATAVQLHYVMTLTSVVNISVVTDSESATEYADFSESVRIRIRGFFAAVSDGFQSSVRESIFTNQVTAFK